MAKKKPQEREMAFLMFMAGELQKNICERVKVTPITLQRWIDEGKWRERRAAQTISRPELINKILGKISELIETHTTGESDDDGKGDAQFADKLIKMANVVERLDKKGSNVVQDMETFMSFNSWLQKRQGIDDELTIELVKLINKYQDIFVGEKMNSK